LLRKQRSGRLADLATRRRDRNRVAAAGCGERVGYLNVRAGRAGRELRAYPGQRPIGDGLRIESQHETHAAARVSDAHDRLLRGGCSRAVFDCQRYDRGGRILEAPLHGGGRGAGRGAQGESHGDGAVGAESARGERELCRLGGREARQQAKDRGATHYRVPFAVSANAARSRRPATSKRRTPGYAMPGCNGYLGFPGTFSWESLLTVAGEQRASQAPSRQSRAPEALRGSVFPFRGAYARKMGHDS
jgi:hypothetical protein